MEGSQRLRDRDGQFLQVTIPIAAFIGGLCCFTPVVVVLFALGSVSYAASLTDLLYYEYAWAFRLAAVGFLIAALTIHLYTNEGVCSVDAAVRKRRKILNLFFVAVIAGSLAYVIWLYVIVEIIGLLLGIW